MQTPQSTNKKGKIIVDERIELPEELEAGDKNLELAMDILFVDRARFLVTIDRRLKFRAAVPIADKSQEEILEALDCVLPH